MRTYSFNTAYTQMSDLYGCELNSDEFESIGLIAWNKIGNKESKLYKYEVKPSRTHDYVKRKDSSEFDVIHNAVAVDNDDWDPFRNIGEFYVDLPCNVDTIEAVTTNYEDYQKTTPTTLAGNNQNGWIQGYIESRKYNTGMLYSSGKFIKYRQEGNRLWLADDFQIVYIFYKGVLVDDDGLPMLNEKEVDAIAAFCAYSHDFKQARLTRDKNVFEIAQVMEQKWKVLCTQARVPDSINENEMDEILNVCTSWDRKRYGKSFKPIK